MTPAGVVMARRPLQPAAAVTLPAVSATALLWCRADKDVFKDSGGTPATASGDICWGWQDQTYAPIYGHSLVSPTNPNFGTFQLNQVNGKPCVRFPGNACMLASWSLSPPFDVFMVVKPITWTSGAMLMSSGSGTNWQVYQHVVSPMISLWNGVGVGGDNSNLTVGAWALLEMGVIVASPDYLKVNNNAATNGGGQVSGNLGGILLAGANPGPASFSNIDVAEVLVYDAILSGTDATAVRAYFTGRYGIP